MFVNWHYFCIQTLLYFSGSSVSNPGVSKSSTLESNLLPISEEDLEKIIRYAIGKLLQGDQTPTDSVLSLRIFYRIDKSLELAQILEVVSQIKEFKISSSVIPVCHLHHPNTFLSIIVIKHDWIVPMNFFEHPNLCSDLLYSRSTDKCFYCWCVLSTTVLNATILNYC